MPSVSRERPMRPSACATTARAASRSAGSAGRWGTASATEAPALAAHLHHELVAAVADELRQREVEAGPGLRSGLHRRAEAGAAGRAAVDGQHEGGLAARAVGRVDEGAAEEDPVLHQDRRELARPHPHERVAGRGRRLGLGHETTVVPAGAPAHDRRRVQVALPGVRPDRVAEEGTVVAPPQPVSAPVLLVVPADRQIGSAPDLVEDDGAVADGGAEQRVTALAQGVEERVEPAGVDDQGVAGFHQEPLLFPEKACKRNAMHFAHQTDRSGRWRGEGGPFFPTRAEARAKLAVRRFGPATRPRSR